MCIRDSVQVRVVPSAGGADRQLDAVHDGWQTSGGVQYLVEQVGYEAHRRVASPADLSAQRVGSDLHEVDDAGQFGDNARQRGEERTSDAETLRRGEGHRSLPFVSACVEGLDGDVRRELADVDERLEAAQLVDRGSD